MKPRCGTCQADLDQEEIHYYDGRCEVCVSNESDRIQAWRKGGEDPELDRRFGAKETVH